MTIANMDTLSAGHQLDLAQQGQSDNNFLVDAVSNPIGAVGAVASDIVLSFANLALFIPDLVTKDDLSIHSDVALKMMADMGMNNAVQYYNQHPDAVQMTSLLAGGWKIGTLGGTKLMKMLGRGEVITTDTGEVISKTVAARRNLKVVAEDFGAGSEQYVKALKEFKTQSAIDTVGTNVAQAAVMDLAMSQSIAAEDLTPADYALGLGIVGAGTYALSNLARTLKVRTEASSESALQNNIAVREHMLDVPVQLQDTIGEGVLLHTKLNTLAKDLEDPTAFFSSTVNQLEQLSRTQQARQIELVQKLMPKEMKLVQGEEGFNLDAQQTMVRLIQDDATLAGAQRIHNFNPDELIPAFKEVDIFEEFRANHGLSEDSMSAMKTALHTMQKNGGQLKKAAPDIAKGFGVSIDSVERLHRIMNTVVVNTRTQTVHSVEEARHIANSVDAPVAKFIDGLSMEQGSTAQIHFNHRVKVDEGIKAVKGSLKLTQEQLGKGISLDERIKLREYMNSGKALREGSVSPIDFNTYDQLQAFKDIETLARAGVSTSTEIAIRSHTRLETVEQLLAKGFNEETFNSLKNSLLLPTGKEAAHELNTAKSLFSVQGDATLGQNTMELAAAMDDRVIRSMNKEILLQEVNSTDSTLIDKAYQLMTGGEAEAVSNGLLGINPGLYNGRFFGSADFALRHQGDAVGAFINFGSRMLQIARQEINALMRPDGVLLQKINTDPFIRTKWNVSEAALRSARPLAGQVTTISEDGTRLGIANLDDTGVIIKGTFQELLDTKGREVGTLPEEVIDYWRQYEQTLGKESFEINNFHRALRGQPKLTSKGIKLAPRDLRDKFIGYVPNAGENGETILLEANNAASLEALAKEARQKYKGADIITKTSDLKNFNIIQNHVDSGEMKLADFGRAKTSAAFEGVSAGSSQLEAFQRANEQYLNRLYKRSVRLMMPETTTFLRQMHESGASELFTTLDKTIFGNSVLTDHPTWSRANEGFTFGVSRALDTLSDGIERIFGVGHDPQTEVHRVMQAFKDKGLDLEKELPWSNLNEAVAQTEAYKALGNKAADAVSNLNFVTSTLALRFLELSHGIVTSLSIPITTIPEVMLAMDSKGSGNFSTMKLMTEGVRRAYSPEFEATRKVWITKGITSAQVSEATEAIRDKAINATFIQKLDSSPAFKWMTKPSDWAEENARVVAASTASAIYDELHGPLKHLTAGGEAFIDLFTKRAMGNYTSAQRPALFQGTLGSAIGLFQTYVWTMGQNIYRGLEAGKPGTVAALMGTQAGIFGLRSLPGYDVTNHFIGQHFGNPNNKDITSTIYNNVGNDAQAETALYGAPATLFQTSLWTRGVLNPRSPISIRTDGALAAAFPGLAPITTAFQVAKDTYDRVANGADAAPSVRAAFQLQQLSRPLSRAADMFAGAAIDRRGGVVDPDAGFKLNLATVIRATAARPMHEQIVRDLSYQTSFYSRANSHNRQDVMKSVRSLLQDGQPLGSQYSRYIKLGGTPAGWKSALNKIYIEDVEGKLGTVHDSTLKDAMGL